MCVLVVGHGLGSLQAGLRASGLKDPHRFSATDTPFAFGLDGLTRRAKSGVPHHSLRVPELSSLGPGAGRRQPPLASIASRQDSAKGPSATPVG